MNDLYNKTNRPYLNTLTQKELIKLVEQRDARLKYLQFEVETLEKDVNRSELIRRKLQKVYGIAN